MNKIDSVTLYGMGSVNSKIYRTFDGGTTWDSLSPVSPMCWISFISKDTGWISTLGGIYKTVNGGLSASFISNQATCGQTNFLKTKYNNENYGWQINNGLYKTTNSGVNWINVVGISFNARYFFFLNKDTGWVTDRPPADNYKILSTINGGINWVVQYSNSISISSLFFSSSLKGWCGTDTSNTILATTNGGIAWGKQIIPIFNSGITFFIDSFIGWTSNPINFNNLAKTTNGGGNIIYSAVETINNIIPLSYLLKQNYPNPFNPSTTIEFSIPKSSTVSLFLFDILGREILNIINFEYLKAGNYKTEIDFTGLHLSSGIYFYTLRAFNNNESFIETKKMVMIK